MKRTSCIALLIAISIPLIALITFLIQPVEILADASNTTIILVNISELQEITVSPDHMQWLQVTPGQNGSMQMITIQNTGSKVFASGIYVSADSYFNATNNPTGGTDPTKYMAGSFLAMANSTHLAQDTWWFVQQVSWNESNYPNPTSPTAGAVSWGYFYNKSDAYLWELKGNSTPSCNMGPDVGASFKIVQTPGSTNLGTVYSGDFLTNDSTWAVWSFSSGILKGYGVATHRSCTYLMAYKFDKNSSLPGATVVNTSYIGSGTLNPGQKTYFWAKASVPKGIPSGTVTNSTVTFTAVT